MRVCVQALCCVTWLVTWSVCWPPFNICHHAPEHCEYQIRHFIMDPSYWHHFVFAVNQVIICIFKGQFHQILCMYRCFQIELISCLAFMIFCNQTCLFVHMNDLDHDFHSYKVYCIKSSCNKICSFTNLSANCHLVSAWPCKFILCGFVPLTYWRHFSHCLMHCCYYLNSFFLFRTMSTTPPPNPFTSPPPVAFAVQLFESYSAICLN